MSLVCYNDIESQQMYVADEQIDPDEEDIMVDDYEDLRRKAKAEKHDDYSFSHRLWHAYIDNDFIDFIFFALILSPSKTS